jgi:hypothetical protein
MLLGALMTGDIVEECLLLMPPFARLLIKKSSLNPAV